LEVIRADSNVRPGVVAISIAFLGGELHESDFSTASGDIGPAARLLEGDGRQENRGDARPVSVVVKRVDESCARGEERRILDIVERLADDVFLGERWGPPSGITDAASEPVCRAIGTTP
jgi:hypothetical protein